MNIKIIILIFLNLLMAIKTIESTSTTHKDGGSEKNSGYLMFGDQFSTPYNYHKSGSLFSVTISGFDIFNYTSLLTAPFFVENRNLPIDKSGVSVIGSGFCYTIQQQILFSIYYFAMNQNFYIQLIQPPNSYCQHVHIFGTTISWVIPNDKKFKNKHHNDTISDSNSSSTKTTTIVEDVEI